MVIKKKNNEMSNGASSVSNNNTSAANNQRQQKAKKYRHAKKKQPHKMKPHGERKSQQQQHNPSKQLEKQIKAQKKQQQSNKSPSASSSSQANGRTSSSSSSLISTLSKKLVGAKFRMINEQLYTTTGAKAKEMFEKNPELYHDYHDGFRSSIEQWPFDPVSNLVSWLKNKPKKLVVADFGCGDARIAKEAKQTTIHSFDLVASNERVTVCDIAHVPLPDDSVDIGLFSLSLMGTNFIDYLKEAHRVLKKGAILKIVELESRFVRFEPFKKLLQKLGFDLQSQLNPDHYFVIFEYRKNENRPSLDVDKIDPLSIMKPCLYKNR